MSDGLVGNMEEMSKAEKDAILAQHRQVRSFYESPAYGYAWDIAQQMMKEFDDTIVRADPVTRPTDIARAQGGISALGEFFASVQGIAKGDLLPETDEEAANREEGE